MPEERRATWTRRDAAVAVALAAATIAVRWPLRTTFLNAWDSVLFALALDEYDFLAQRPHAPGYPLFIALARVPYALGMGHNASLVTVSMVASVAAVLLLYGLLREAAPVWAAAGASAMFSVAPVHVYNGTVALSYTVEGAASVGIAWLAWRVRARPSTRGAAMVGVAWGVAAGLRLSLAPFLVGLAAWAWTAAPTGRERARHAAAGAAAAAASGLAWLVPMLVAGGGWDAWRRATSLQTQWVILEDTVFTGGSAALADHAARLLHFTRHELVLGAVAAIALGWAALARGRAPAVASRRAAWFALAWIGPSLTFYLLVFDGWDRGPVGYALVYLPALYAAFGLVVHRSARALAGDARSGPRVAYVVLSVALMTSPLPVLAHGALELSRAEGSDHDAWAASWERLPEAFPPNETAILVWYSWAHVKWHFPQYTAWSYLPVEDPQGRKWAVTLETRDREDDVPFYVAHEAGPGQPEHPIPSHVRHLVIFDFQLAGENGAERRLVPDVVVEEAWLPGQWRVLVAEVPPGAATVESLFLSPDQLRGPWRS